MKKVLSSLFVLALMVAMLPVGTVFAGEAVTFDLMAGQNIDVGSVTVSDDGANLTVLYTIDVEGWYIVQAHLYADTKAPKNGAPGRFPFNSGPLHDTSFAFTVPLADLGVESGDELYIAAHAVVNNEFNTLGYMDSEGVMHDEPGFDCPSMEEVAAALPGSVNMVVSYPGAASYLDVTISGGTALDGTYANWCIDATHLIYPGTTYTANVYSSYEPLPETLTGGDNPNIDKEENLDLVNWVVNQDFVSQGYSTNDVQTAIWVLIDDNPQACGTGCQTIVDAAYANGEGFVPSEPDDVIAIILQPVDDSGNSSGQITIGQVTIAQVTLFGLGLECTPWEQVFQSETGWAVADSGTYFKNGWGSYFIYTL